VHGSSYNVNAITGEQRDYSNIATMCVRPANMDTNVINETKYITSVSAVNSLGQSANSPQSPHSTATIASASAETRR